MQPTVVKGDNATAVPNSPLSTPWTAISTALISASIALAVAWLGTLLLAERSLPWQATRNWMAVFGFQFLLVALQQLRHWGRVGALTTSAKGWRSAISWGVAPILILTVPVIILAYTSDQFYELLEWPYKHMQFVAAFLILLCAQETLQAASLAILNSNKGAIQAVREALTKRSSAMIITSLVVVGVLQAAAATSPVGDDIGKYSEAAQALLNRDPYPVHRAAAYLIDVGMSPDSPAMPLLPIILAASYSIFGTTTAGMVAGLAAIAAVFPLAMYWACRNLTGSRIAGYACSALLTLFPVYQIHVLGTPVPDTLFVVTLLALAALAVNANGSTRWRYWIAMGVANGLVANSRPEGLSFSIAVLGTLLLFHIRKRQFWGAVLAYLLVIAPFALTYRSVAGSFWPTTFGGTVGLEHLDANLSYLHYFALPWYEQAIGLPAPALAVAGVAIVITIIAGGLLILKNCPALLFIPLLGVGYIATSLLLHPIILMSYTPVDALRHWSSGIPFVVLTIAYALHTGIRAAGIRMARQPLRTALVVALVALLCAVIYYEVERLARPEPHFEGQASLLWTGSSYLLTDVFAYSTPLPGKNDPRTGEELRRDTQGRMDAVDLHFTNLSEPYHWTTLMVVLSGLIYALGPLKRGEPAGTRRLS